jgi:propanol-preferring alcohol dehydrogenase
MRAMILRKLNELNPGATPLKMVDIPIPVPGPNEVLIKVHVCGVCHTELDEIEGRTPPPKLPVILGHQVVGTISKLGNGVDGFEVGERVGVAWIYSACGDCEF